MNLREYQRIFLVFYIFLKISECVQEWTKVYLDEEYLINDRLSESFQINSLIHCAGLCGIKYYCKTWCRYDFSTCTLSSTIVSPKYETTAGSVKCYTKNRRDVMVSSIQASSRTYNTSTKTRYANDGVFLRDYGFVFESMSLEKPWSVFNLRKSFKISEIRINSDFEDMCFDLEIKIGDTHKTHNDFGTYTLFPFSLDSCTPVDGEWLLRSPIPITGQYVSIVRLTSPGSPKALSFNYVEIDGE